MASMQTLSVTKTASAATGMTSHSKTVAPERPGPQEAHACFTSQ
jgi:hypothetical protein